VINVSLTGRTIASESLTGLRAIKSNFSGVVYGEWNLKAPGVAGGAAVEATLAD
jgi:hypothetical protein